MLVVQINVMADVTAKQLEEFEKWLEKKNGKTSKSKSPAQRAARKPLQRSATKSDKNTTQKPKRLKKRRRAGFSEEVRTAAHVRAGDLCENPLCGRQVSEIGGEHHCIPRSQYRKSDRNDLWNCACICEGCHTRVTSPRSEEDKRLRRYFERCANARKILSGDSLGLELQALEKALRENTLDTVRSFELLSTSSS